MDIKLSDDEIVKALECCREKDCCDCPMSEYPQTICEWDAFDLAIDLINRKKAEIERLEKTLTEQFDSYESIRKRAKTEAIKEFAERLKDTPFRFREELTIDWSKPPITKMVLFVDDNDIDNLVKEMTEDKP